MTSAANLGDLKEVSITIRHEGCWLTELSRGFPNTTTSIWALYQAGDRILAEAQVQGATDAARAAIKEWLSRVDEIHELRFIYDGPGGLRFHVQYGTRGSMYPIIARHKLVALTSSAVSEGLERYTLVGEASDVQKLVGELSERWPCEVRSTASVKASLLELLSGSMVRDARLTERQWTALQVAHAHGYYEVPRKVSLAVLARKMDISASSFLYHLRRGEQKLLGVIISGQVHQRRRAPQAAAGERPLRARS